LSKPANKTHAIYGVLLVLLGLYPIALALGFQEVDAASSNAPMWVIALCGVVFVIGGCMILLRQHERLVDLLAALICLSLASIGVWVSLFSPAEGFSGGISLVPDKTNIGISRWVFGGGAVISFLCFVYAVRRALQ
jgi:hypothetical protein